MAVNDAKIIGGLFQSDPNKGFWGRTWELFSRWTWQSPQVFTGLGWSLAKNFVGAVDRVEYFDDITYIINENWKGSGKQGVTLGNYINIDMEGKVSNSTSFSEYVTKDNLFMHEYGHTIQSKRWGPLYLFSIGIPSGISQLLDIWEWGGHDHDYFYSEIWANRNALKYFSETYGDIVWDYFKYPIEKKDRP